MSYISYLLLSTLGSDAFAPVNHPAAETSSSCLFKARRKGSMAERRKRRQAKFQNPQNPFENLPPAKLDFSSKAPRDDGDDQGPTRVESPNEAANQARQLLESQRKSVNMLTMVRERIEALPAEEVLEALDKCGYFVFDGFLGDDSVLDELEAEAVSLYEGGAMEAGTSNLGSGEYVVKIEGGNEQYTKCPRSVELVVSTTKHFPEAMESMNLDASVCMAGIRTFDRKVFKASLGLLTGSEKMPDEGSAFGTVVVDADDKRKLTLYLYLLPESWEGSFGGGLTFESGDSVLAKRDRLVIFNSDSTRFKKSPWKGGDENEVGSCMELHLVNKRL